MKFWDDKDGTGAKLTDGRVCLVIRSDENPDMPEIRTYGKDREEVLDKLAKTAETAQGQIHRLRKAAPAINPTSAPRPAAAAPDLATAVADLANPAKAGAAVKTLLKSVGVDVDAQQMRQALINVANMAEQWEMAHPDYPKDPRNDRILMKMAANLAGGAHRVTAAHLDAAFEEAQRDEMLHEPKTLVVDPTVQPGGNPDSRTVRTVQTATSYRRNSLRSAEPPPVNRESARETKWRTILEKGTGKEQEDAIRNEPGYLEWVDRVMKKSA